MPKKGYIPTENHRKNLSKALKGKYKGISYKQRYGEEKADKKRLKHSINMKGYKHLDEIKIKIGLANKGNILGFWEERFSTEYIKKRKLKHSIWMKKLSKGTWEERFGIEKAKQIRIERKKSWEERFGIEKANKMKNNYKKQRAKQILPVCDSKPEQQMQKILNILKIKFKKHIYLNAIEHSYQCDIFIKPNLVIEVDGKYWHNYPHGKEIDHIRTRELTESGYNVLRFWENEFNINIVEEKLNEINTVNSQDLNTA